MRVETSLERAVFHHRDWRLELQRECQKLRERAPEGWAEAAGAVDLARSLELAEPNRVHAVEMYLLGWKAAHEHPEGLERAYELCLELGQLPTAAKIARILFLQTREPLHARREGMAWLDAGHPDRAVRALLAASRDEPSNEITALALATARREWPDVRAEIAALRGRAGSSPGHGASELLLQAARIARMLGPDDDALYGEVLGDAVDAAPTNESAFSLLEMWLAGRGERDALMSIYTRRAEAAPDQALELLRRAGTKWVMASSHVGLGVRLLSRCLELGYASDSQIPGHLATLALLRRFAEMAGAETELLNLIGRGLARDHSRPEMAALAAVGLDIAWRRLRAPRLSHPLALILGEVAREHPNLLAYCADGGMAKGQAQAHQREPEVFYLDQLPAPAPGEPSGLLDLAAIDEPGDDIVLELADGDLVELDGGGVPDELIFDGGYPLAVPQIVERSPENERRDGDRFRIPADVMIRVGENTIETVTRDISEGGMFVLTDQKLEVSSSIALIVALPQLHEWSVDEFALAGRVVRSEAGGYAVDLIDPPSSYVSRVRALLA